MGVPDSATSVNRQWHIGLIIPPHPHQTNPATACIYLPTLIGWQRKSVSHDHNILLLLLAASNEKNKCDSSSAHPVSNRRIHTPDPKMQCVAKSKIMMRPSGRVCQYH